LSKVMSTEPPGSGSAAACGAVALLVVAVCYRERPTKSRSH